MKYNQSDFKPWDDYLAGLPEERRLAIGAATARGVLEVGTYEALRALLPKVRRAVARKLKLPGSAMDGVERQADLYVETLRRQVEAAGGKLQFRLEMPGHPPVTCDDLGDLLDLQTPWVAPAQEAAA